MRAKHLTNFLKFMIQEKEPVLIKGAPGIGKTDIVQQACQSLGYKLVVSHPVVSDPTDYKGLPFPAKDKDMAEFLPFGDLVQLIKADKPTVFFMDDLGQAPAAVQAAAMQLILARRINGHKVSDKVIFLAATNRRKDKAGVQGILEPVKSRFASIVELEVSTDDWIEWAFNNNVPPLLIAFIRFRPDLLHNFKATSDIVNSPCPRSVAAVGRMINNGLPRDLRYEAISGAAGEGFAAEYIAFTETYDQLPNIKDIIDDPEGIEMPTKASTLYALSGLLVKNINKKNINKLMKFIQRMQREFQVMVVRDFCRQKKSLAETEAFSDWATENQDIILA
jgi:hypothetical protein